MNEAIAFDTHRYVKRLIASGFSELQAETLAEEQIAFLNANLATKADVAQIHADIDALRQETKAGIESLRQETKTGIESLRQETKTGIESLRQETKAGIESLRQETKAGIESLRQETKAGIELLRQETKADISRIEANILSVKAELIKWVFAALIAQGGLIVALVKLL